MYRFRPWIGDYRDPDCPYTDDYTAEDEEDDYDAYVDRCVDERLEDEG